MCGLGGDEFQVYLCSLLSCSQSEALQERSNQERPQFLISGNSSTSPDSLLFNSDHMWGNSSSLWQTHCFLWYRLLICVQNRQSIKWCEFILMFSMLLVSAFAVGSQLQVKLLHGDKENNIFDAQTSSASCREKVKRSQRPHHFSYHFHLKSSCSPAVSMQTILTDDDWCSCMRRPCDDRISAFSLFILPLSILSVCVCVYFHSTLYSFWLQIMFFSSLFPLHTNRS